MSYALGTAAVVPATTPIARRIAPPAAPSGVRPVAGRRILADSDVGARLLRRLDVAIATPSPETFAALRAAVTDLVDRLKAQDLPLDRVLGVIDALVQEHGTGPRVLALPTSPSSPRAPATAPATVEARLRTWGMRAYRDDDWW